MKAKRILTLGIETSCDETSVAVVLNGREILANVIATQIPIHRKYGGVVPEIASRNHIVEILPTLEEALREADLSLKDISETAVTYGPGLQGALLVGLAFAKSLAFALDVPLVGVNHLEGHIFANFLSDKELQPPFLALIVSGGHTALVDVLSYNEFHLLGETRDDAAGEAFDKIARVLGLAYPGGPEIDRLAKEGDPTAIHFPKALLEKNNHEFSFSGLKSAVLNYLNSEKMKGTAINPPDVAASFQKTVVDILEFKALDALKKTRRQTLVIAGGVAANSLLKARFKSVAEENGFSLSIPPLKLCTDNAAMIASRGYYKAREGLFADDDLNVVPNLKLRSY